MATPSDAMEGLSACECPVCFNFLSETLPPMSMPCGHTLCSQCVEQLVSKSTVTVTTSGRVATSPFRCPLCREWVNRDAVHINVTLRDLIAELTSIGVKPGNPESHKARVLSALHVNYGEIEVGASLDRGAFGEVFKGVWRGNDIALKMFVSGIMTPEAMQAFQREVFVMNCLRHPNVVLLMGACQTPPKLAILMEFVAGGSLHKLIHVDKVMLSLEETCMLGGDICCGLQYLHSINILHRDLKSKNVLLSAPPPSGHAKLCDFGLARMRLESATLTGNVGTVHWSAPEVLSNSRYKFPADVYSLGMVLFEMACGRVPFHSMVPLAVMMAVAVKKEKPEVPPTVDPRMATIINDCISWEPDDRPSVGGVLSSLRNLTPSQSHQATTIQERRAHLSHSDSLGVVFVSVSDTADLGRQDDELVGVAKQMGLVPPADTNRSLSEEDRALAWELMKEENETMLARDEELAHQLQVRENTYRSPSDSSTSVFPPKNILDSIKSLKKKSPSSESTDWGADAPHGKMKSKKVANVKTVPNRTKVPVLKTKASNEHAQTVAPSSTHTKLAKKAPSSTEHAHTKIAKKAPSSTEHAHTKIPKKAPSSTEHAHTKIAKKAPSSTEHAHTKMSKKAPSSTERAQKSQLGKMEQLRSKTGSFLKKMTKPFQPSPPSPPPPPPLTKQPGPPPPPPPPPLIKQPTPRNHYNLPSAGKMMSTKGRLLTEVRTTGKRVAQRLRPVETVEKRGFRIGRVVDGYDSERAQYTIQNQVQSFSRRVLHHVDLYEPTPPFLVGKVVQPSRRLKVKRLSSMIETREATSPMKLNPFVKSEIVSFPVKNLHHVIPEVKQQLPTEEDILSEREQVSEPLSPPVIVVQSNYLPDSRKLHPKIQSDIETFPVSNLRHVTIEVKQHLPTAEDILSEREQVSEPLSPPVIVVQSHYLPDSRKLHPKIQSDIETFPVNSLRHVTIEVKLHLPTAEEIVRERSSLSPDPTIATQGASQSGPPIATDNTQIRTSEQLELENEKLQGFW